MTEQTNLHVEFYTEPVENPAKTREQGRPIFEDKEFVRIKFPGDKHRVHVAPADEQSLRDPQTNDWLTYKDRFPAHYEAFRKNAVFVGEGTPIDEAPFLTASKKAELKGVNIHTVESLADLPDSNLSKMGVGAREMKNQARAYLDKANGSKGETKLAAENAGLRARLERLEANLSNREGIQPGLSDTGKAAEERNQERHEEPKPDNQDESDADDAKSDAASPFTDWTDESLKAFIKDKTGQAPRGNPSHETLIRMAEEAHKPAS